MCRNPDCPGEAGYDKWQCRECRKHIVAREMPLAKRVEIDPVERTLTYKDKGRQEVRALEALGWVFGIPDNLLDILKCGLREWLSDVFKEPISLGIKKGGKIHGKDS